MTESEQTVYIDGRNEGLLVGVLSKGVIVNGGTSDIAKTKKIYFNLECNAVEVA